jgi:hypothetical protein
MEIPSTVGIPPGAAPQQSAAARPAPAFAQRSPVLPSESAPVDTPPSMSDPGAMVGPERRMPLTGEIGPVSWTDHLPQAIAAAGGAGNIRFQQAANRALGARRQPGAVHQAPSHGRHTHQAGSRLAVDQQDRARSGKAQNADRQPAKDRRRQLRAWRPGNDALRARRTASACRELCPQYQWHGPAAVVLMSLSQPSDTAVKTALLCLILSSLAACAAPATVQDPKTVEAVLCSTETSEWNPWSQKDACVAGHLAEGWTIVR